MPEPSFLLVDESPFVLTGLAEMLGFLNFKKVTHTTSTTDAWTMTRLNSIDCLICSWDMPNMTGLALLQILRSDDKLADTAIFLSREEFTNLQVVESGRAGVTGLIVKPYNLDTIRKKVKAFMEVKTEPAIVEARSNLNRGMKLLEAGDHNQALKEFENMVAEGESAEVYYNIGYIKTSQGKHDEALLAFQKATQLDRLFAKAYEAMGRVYRELGQPGKAEKYLQRAADIYVSKEEDEYAEQVLQEILEISPDTINVYNSLGVIFRKKGDPVAALKNYQKALKVHPNEPNIYYNIGRIHIELKRREESKTFFRKALQIDPTFKDARDVLRAIEMGSI